MSRCYAPPAQLARLQICVFPLCDLLSCRLAFHSFFLFSAAFCIATFKIIPCFPFSIPIWTSLCFILSFSCVGMMHYVASSVYLATRSACDMYLIRTYAYLTFLFCLVYDMLQLYSGVVVYGVYHIMFFFSF